MTLLNTSIKGTPTIEDTPIVEDIPIVEDTPIVEDIPIIVEDKDKVYFSKDTRSNY